VAVFDAVIVLEVDEEIVFDCPTRTCPEGCGVEGVI
jgi:hypothetical protein